MPSGRRSRGGLLRREMAATRQETTRRLVALGDWLDERTGYRWLLRESLYHAVPTKGGWWYTLGSATLALIGLQITTGIFLIFIYVPSTTEAWSSLEYLKTSDPFGAVVRGMHLWGAYLLLFMIGLHLVRTFMSASYKRPRELNWLTGCILLLLVLGLSITGAFLPDDQAAYWTGVVVTNIPAYIPVIGPYIRDLWRGGPSFGPETLTRTYGIHIWLLASVLIAFIGAHLLLLLKHGEFGSWVNYRGSWRTRPPLPTEELAAQVRQTEPPYPTAPTDEEWSTPLETTDFYPEQTFKDALVSAFLILVVLGLAVVVGAPLEDRADPATITYVPTPEWFFLPLDQLLVLLPQWFISVVIWLPLIGTVFLFAVPWIDRGPERDPFERPAVVIPAVIIILSLLTLTMIGAGRLFTL